MPATVPGIGTSRGIGEPNDIGIDIDAGSGLVPVPVPLVPAFAPEDVGEQTSASAKTFAAGFERAQINAVDPENYGNVGL